MSRKAYFREDGGALAWVNGTGSPVAAGDVVNLGDRIGVAAQDIAAGATGTVHTKGVFRIVKDTTTFAAGDDVDYDVSAGKASDVGVGAAGDLMHIGKCAKAAATGVSYVDVEINVPVTMEVKA